MKEIKRTRLFQYLLYLYEGTVVTKRQMKQIMCHPDFGEWEETLADAICTTLPELYDMLEEMEDMKKPIAEIAKDYRERAYPEPFYKLVARLYGCKGSQASQMCWNAGLDTETGEKK